MKAKFLSAMTIVAIAIPIVWPWIAAAIPALTRTYICCGLVILTCVWGTFSASISRVWLAVNMGTGALAALVCRYPRHGGEAHRASVSIYEDIAFGAGIYGVLTCICEVLIH